MHELIGLLPAAGQGSRLAQIPSSKEIMSLGFHPRSSDDNEPWQLVTPIEEHLRALKTAGASRCVIVINSSKTEILRYLGNGDRFGLSIAYLVASSQNRQPLHGMPFSLDLAASWLDEAITLFSMPDTIIMPQTTMARLAHHHQQYPADVTLGLFRTDTPAKFGMVALDEEGRVCGFVDKPAQSTLEYMWGIAAWSPRFTKFLHSFLAEVVQPDGSEIVLSEIFAAALHQLTIQTIIFEDAQYYDIGTPADFQAFVTDLDKHYINHGSAKP